MSAWWLRPAAIATMLLTLSAAAGGDGGDGDRLIHQSAPAANALLGQPDGLTMPQTITPVTVSSPAGIHALLQSSDLGSAWRLSTNREGTGAALRFSPESGGVWDWSARAAVEIGIRNPGTAPLTVRASITNPDAKDLTGTCQTAATIMPGQKELLSLRIVPTPQAPDYEIFRPFFKYYTHVDVRDNTVDPTRINALTVWIDIPAAGDAIEIFQPQLSGVGRPGPIPFFPFVDRYGQYIHADWPGKIHSDADFALRRTEEEKDRANWPGPKNWSKFGGWADGPQLEATGFFRVAKHEGKWWLVDPEGKLFWSYAPTGAGFGQDLTPVTDREYWFSDLPPRDGPAGQFYSPGPKVLYQYYRDRDYLCYQFSLANAQIKYGADATERLKRVTAERLRSWGFNSMGAWSAAAQMQHGQTAYTTIIHYSAPGLSSHMPDVFNPEWEASLRARLQQERDTTAKDPWNIGYFVDNERKWARFPRFIGVALQALEAKPDVVSKSVFIADLQAKYQTIERLNESWGTQHASWDAMLQATDKVIYEHGKNAALDQDLGDFGMKFGHRYFATCRKLVKEVAPHHMYMGARLHGHVDPTLIDVQTQYCDVISYNMYDPTPDQRMSQYEDIDFPFLITEWGIDSDPRQSPFRASKAEVSIGTKIPRRGAIERFTRDAIVHPKIVGIHFFQYRDQPLSGRPDGEALLRGFVNATDTPNFELIQVNRRFAYDLYETRAGANRPPLHGE